MQYYLPLPEAEWRTLVKCEFWTRSSIELKYFQMVRLTGYVTQVSKRETEFAHVEILQNLNSQSSRESFDKPYLV